MFSTDDIFAPLDAEYGVHTEFTVGHDRRNSCECSLPSAYIQPPFPSHTPHRIFIPRKPVPINNRFTMKASSILSIQTDTVVEIEEEKAAAAARVNHQNRGWRFYGAFACLALLNLVCAIDATILSVALPVRPHL